MPAVSMRSMANFPRVVSNHMGALRPLVRNKLLNEHSLTSRVRTVGRRGVTPVSFIIIGLCPFGRAVDGGSIALTSTVRGVSVNNPDVLHDTTGGCTDMAILASPVSCRGILTRLRTTNRAAFRAHRTLTTGIFHRATDCSTLVTRCLAGIINRARPRGLAIACSLGRDLHCKRGNRRATAFCRRPLTMPFSVTDTIRLRKGRLSCGGVGSTSTTVHVTHRFSRPTMITIGRVGPYNINVTSSVSTTFSHYCTTSPISVFNNVIITGHPLSITATRGLGDVFLRVILTPDCARTTLTVLSGGGGIHVVALSFSTTGTNKGRFISMLNNVLRRARSVGARSMPTG